jgi:hypothetical protein
LVRKELERYDFEDRQEEIGGEADFEDVLDELLDVLAAFDGDDATAAGGDLPDVGEGLFVLEDTHRTKMIN